jgi:hypothetical protein
MSELKITHTDANEYHLTNRQGNFLGKLTYENWLRSKASITTQYGEFYDLNTKGFWKTHVEVEIGGDIYATLRQNWRGYGVIDITESDIDRDYLVKSRGFWKPYYVVLNRDENEVLSLIPHRRLFKKMDYWVTINPNFQQEATETLILLAVYCVNAIKRQKQAATAAAAG